MKTHFISVIAFGIMAVLHGYNWGLKANLSAKTIMLAYELCDDKVESVNHWEYTCTYHNPVEFNIR